MRAKLQALRDEAERQCELACHRNDTDSAAAWEQIGIELDELQERIKHHWRVIEQRAPLVKVATLPEGTTSATGQGD